MTDDRGVSVTVTHVLTIGITTILVAGLLLGAGNMLEDQRQSTGDRELRSIGDRTVTEIVTAVDTGASTNSTTVVESRQPGSAIGGSYVVSLSRLGTGEECYTRSGYDGCLVLDASASSIGVEVPISVPAGVTIANGTAQGGDVEIVYTPNETVTIRGDGT